MIKLKDLKKQISINATAFVFINYKSNYYSFSSLLNEIKKIIKENNYKNFDLAEFLNYFFEEIHINLDDALNYYFYKLIANKDIFNKKLYDYINEFSIYGNHKKIETTSYINFLSTDGEPSGWGGCIILPRDEARLYLKNEFNIDIDIDHIVEYKDKIIFKNYKKNIIMEKLKVENGKNN